MKTPVSVVWAFALATVSLFSCKEKRPVVHAEKNGALVFSISDNPVLSYQFEVVFPPEGVDSAYRRSGFIHPLYAPHGQILTLIQPEDHYHHYGIWNPWTHVLFEGDTLDFWNLKKREGTVRFARFENSRNNGFRALHEHVVLKNGLEKVALNEWFEVEITPGATGDYYIVDIISEYSCATQNPFKILEYRYAGLGWRTTEVWDDKNRDWILEPGQTYFLKYRLVVFNGKMTAEKADVFWEEFGT